MKWLTLAYCLVRHPVVTVRLYRAVRDANRGERGGR